MKVVIDKSLKSNLFAAEGLQGDNVLLLDGGKTLSLVSTAGASSSPEVALHSAAQATWAVNFLVL